MRRLGTLSVVLGVIVLMGIECLSQEKPVPIYTKAPESFDRQFQAAYNAYKNGDDQGIKSIADTFKLPHDWFVKYFGSDHAADLEKEYTERFKYFEWQTMRRFHWMDKAEDSTIDTRVYIGDKPLAPLGKSVPASLLPLPEAKMYSILYTKAYGTFHLFGRDDKPEGDSFSWAYRFVELDGEYKFFGLGGYPFWDIPPMGLADMCAPEGDKTSGILVKRVAPEVSKAALQTSKPGIVVICLTIAKDGSVTDVQFVRGDAALFPAAKTAAMQWKYTPWMNCGHAVEMRTMDSVEFTPTS